MMKLNLALTLMFATLALGASPAPARADTDPVEQAYYQQFVYQEVQVGEGAPSYRYLSSMFGLQIPTADGAIDTIMDLFLQTDGTYLFRYQEMKNYMPVFEDEFEGYWSVPEKNLVVGNIATGERAMDNQNFAVKLTFTRDLHTAGLQGKSIVLPYVWSNVGLNHH